MQTFLKSQDTFWNSLTGVSIWALQGPIQINLPNTNQKKKKLAKHKSVDQNTNQFIETQINSSKTVFPETQTN